MTYICTVMDSAADRERTQWHACNRSRIYVQQSVRQAHKLILVIYLDPAEYIREW